MNSKPYRNKIWLNNMYSKYGCTHISKICGVDEKTILYWLKKHNINIRSRSDSLRITHARKYQIDEHIFDQINTPEKAYWLGFLMADGAMRKINNSYILSFELSAKDGNMVVAFNNFLGSNYPVQYAHESSHDSIRARLNISNHALCESLISHGIVPHKTGKEQIPASVPDSFKRDFIRGFFDGDGCITLSHRRSNTLRCKVHMVCCSQQLLNDISNYLAIKKTDKTVHPKSGGQQHIFEFETSNLPNIAIIYDTLYYDGCVCMERKKNIFKAFLVEYKQSKLLMKRYSPTH